MFFILVALLTAFILVVILDRQKNTRRPPGPFRFPILGNLPQTIAADPYIFRAYLKLSKTYGDIMSNKVGLQEMVVLSSFDTMKELITREEFGERLWNGILVDRSLGKQLGILFGKKEHQDALKAFTNRNLREYGFGKRESMESIMRIELEEMLQRLHTVVRTNGGKLVMERFFQLSILNVTWTMIAARRYSHDDPKLHKLLELNSTWFQSGNVGGGLVTAYPFLRFVFPNLLGYNKQVASNEGIYEYLTEMVKEYREREGYDTDPQSFIDVFLSQIKKEADKPNSHFTDESFKVMCYDFFQAGFETTSNTLAFGMLFMVLNLDAQSKVQKELDGVYSQGAVASRDDEKKLPYTTAAIYEVFRLGNVIPISGPRIALSDVKYRDYLIQKGSGVIFNTYAVMRDEKIWGDPDKFRPERFLDAGGQLIAEKTQVMSIVFGAGKRSCLGEVLSRTTVFMTFATLMRNFRFEPAADKPLPSTEPNFGIILSPQPYEVVITPRA